MGIKEAILTAGAIAAIGNAGWTGDTQSDLAQSLQNVASTSASIESATRANNQPTTSAPK